MHVRKGSLGNFSGLIPNPALHLGVVKYSLKDLVLL